MGGPVEEVGTGEMSDCHQSTRSDTDQPETQSGLRRWIYVGLGCVFVALGGIGVVLPGLPTTPFLLLASYFFVRSSPQLNQRLLRSKTFGPILRDWHSHRGVNRRIKTVALISCTAMITLSLAFGGLPMIGRVVVAIAGAYGIWFVARLPTVPTVSESSSHPTERSQ